MPKYFDSEGRIAYRFFPADFAIPCTLTTQNKGALLLFIFLDTEELNFYAISISSNTVQYYLPFSYNLFFDNIDKYQKSDFHGMDKQFSAIYKFAC